MSIECDGRAMRIAELTQLVFALTLDHGHPGRSPYSFEVLEQCGKDARAPTCDVQAPCDDGLHCAPPKFSPARRAWVRIERRETATRRFAKIAHALADSTRRLAECTARDGTKLEPCTPIEWSGSTRDLALAALTVALHESGLREDVMFGRPPLGRGPAGEACLMQVAPNELTNAPWLDPEQRQEAVSSPRAREQIAKTLLGDSQEALGRCFELGIRLLARSRRSCERSGVPWESSMFALYGTGKTCRAPALSARTKTFRTLRAARPLLSEELLAELGEAG